jgi:hypothetical protein
MATSYGDNHDAIGAWFLGPHAENFEVLERIFQGLLYEQAKARAAYFPNDDDFITPSMKASKLFQSKYPFTVTCSTKSYFCYRKYQQAQICRKPARPSARCALRSFLEPPLQCSHEHGYDNARHGWISHGHDV